jgi:riboflavin kinase/FMN adenylyltransferase
MSGMQLIRNRPGAVAEGFARNHASQGSVVTVGNFDGLHRGHLALLGRCRELADENLAEAVMTFEPLPEAFFRPEQAPPRLSTVYQKLQLLRSLGVDIVWLTRFDREFASLTAREFVEVALAGTLRARHVVVGEDFRFGRGRQGDVAMLRQLGAEFGFEVDIVPAVFDNGDRISSSRIRQDLADGAFDAAAGLLGRPFRMEGHVVRGARLGGKLGYPTANLRIRAQPSPLGGVLAVFARIGNGAWRPAVANLGRRPAVGGREPLLEVHFFDFDEDIYGQRLEVQFVAKLRDEANFESLEALVGQMRRDEQAARDCLVRASRRA